jgi:hypothetical protein
LLLDRTHRTWFLAFVALSALAVALHAWLGRDVPGGLNGGTTTGLWYGLAGAGLMLFAGALSAHRRLMAIRWLPARRWLGMRQTWLRGHIWLGLLSVVVILCHANYHLGGPLEVALWTVLGVTILSGVVGLALQIVLPRLITNRARAEAPYEQIPHLCDVMRRDADDALAAAEAKLADHPAPLEELRVFHARARAFLSASYDRSSPLATPLRTEMLFARLRSLPGLEAVREELGRLEVLCDERRQLGEQARLHRWLHLWLLLHVPVTVALLVLGTAHAVLSVYW